MRTQRVLQFGKHCCYDSQTNAHKESARSAKRERESVAGVMAVGSGSVQGADAETARSGQCGHTVFIIISFCFLCSFSMCCPCYCTIIIRIFNYFS